MPYPETSFLSSELITVFGACINNDRDNKPPSIINSTPKIFFNIVFIYYSNESSSIKIILPFNNNTSPSKTTTKSG